MAQDQGQGASADGAEADHDHRAGQAPVGRVLVHGVHLRCRGVSGHEVGAQRLETVEPHRRVRGGVGAGRHQLDPVADSQISWKLVAGPVVEDVRAVTRWAGEDDRLQRPVLAGDRDAVTDGLLERLGEPVEHADVQIDPASLVIGGAAGDQHDLGLDQSGFTDQVASGFDQDLSGERMAQVRIQRTAGSLRRTRRYRRRGRGTGTAARLPG